MRNSHGVPPAESGTPASEPRRFNRGQRLALWLADDGHCAACGCALASGWHADHWAPYARGGATDVTNGQALCPACNLKKGAGVNPTLGVWPAGLALRRWQTAAFELYRQRQQRDFMLVATPGAGKSLTAMRIAHSLLQVDAVDRLVVVVPTEHLRRQWAEVAFRAGIQLNPDWTNGDMFEQTDFHGICATYHSVAANPDIYRLAANRRRTLVVLDEVHHAGDSLSWGSAIRQAFEPATFRLMLSGTPFRSDNNTIPFVTYLNEKSVADFGYGLGAALTDSVCRPIMFPKYEGEMHWLGNAGLKSATFADDLSQEEASRRLRTALDVRGEWLRTVIREADAELVKIRANVQPDAAGLILCVDQAHARQVATLVRQETGEEPAIAISEDADATERIHAFARGRSKWLVSVRMVSEGVDVPRLYVGVYATNIITELFFRQVVGRFVRMVEGVEGQVALLFIPQEDTLVSYAERIKEEREHAIEEIERRAREWDDERDAGRNPSTFVPIGSKASAGGLVWDGAQYSPALTEEAARKCALVGISDPNVILGVMKVLNLDWQEAPPQPVRGSAELQPVFEKRQQLRTAGTVKSRRLGFLVKELAGRADFPAHELVNSKVMQGVGCRVKDMTKEQLEQRLRLLDGWIQEAQAQQRAGTGLAWLVRWEER